ATTLLSPDPPPAASSPLSLHDALPICLGRFCERLAHTLGRGPPGRGARRERSLGADLVERAGLETLVVSAQLAEGHATKILARRESLADDLAHDLVRLAERHAALREVVGEIRGREHPALGRPTHRLTVEANAAHHEREN